MVTLQKTNYVFKFQAQKAKPKLEHMKMNEK